MAQRVALDLARKRQPTDNPYLWAIADADMINTATQATNTILTNFISFYVHFVILDINLRYTNIWF